MTEKEIRKALRNAPIGSSIITRYRAEIVKTKNGYYSVSGYKVKESEIIEEIIKNDFDFFII